MNRDVDVLLVDLGLPDGDGCDPLRELLSIKKVPAIAVTGFSMTQDIERSRAAGFTAYITKPLQVPELREMLTNLKLDRTALLPDSAGADPSIQPVR